MTPDLLQGTRSRTRGLPGRIMAWLLGCLAGLVFLILIVVTAVTAVAGWAVHFGGGQHGTFTEVSQSCGRSACMWDGTFTTAHGSVQPDVTLENGGVTAAGPPGGPVPAVSVLGQVYPAGGGPAVAQSTIAFVVELLALFGVVGFWRRRRRQRRVPPGGRGPVTGP
jgi:hypothetical protein